jgi:hypothetical protein
MPPRVKRAFFYVAIIRPESQPGECSALHSTENIEVAEHRSPCREPTVRAL